MLAMPGPDWYGAEPYFAMVRFGLWEQMLVEPRPNPALKSLTGAWLFASATALAAGNRIAEATQRLDELNALRAALPADVPAGLNSAADVLQLAALIAKSQIERAQRRPDAAIATLTEAVALEDRLGYDEPADWFFPVRHLLGAELLKAGKNTLAESVYRDDLRRNPDNGWSLFGLAQALRSQGQSGEAAATEALFNKAWKHADITLKASAM